MFDAERHQPLLPLKARLEEVTNFLETDNIKTQVLGKIAKNYYFSGKGYYALSYKPFQIYC
ncbi:hypothetical protein F9817_16150 [Vibrio sp. CAIM 722]|uniref:Uncharacterized protein n=1 Tax=Vibrio eleionomae TaxID=2653505 RepID=A0A7X4LMN6_9VIBR|nr:hypothetical protein [Vibrio eleionomae]MZI94714.1 hypothetical protein [Vibrio eleionomae]